jgi:hypothetical protein
MVRIICGDCSDLIATSAYLQYDADKKTLPTEEMRDVISY